VRPLSRINRPIARLERDLKEGPPIHPLGGDLELREHRSRWKIWAVGALLVALLVWFTPQTLPWLVKPIAALLAFVLVAAAGAAWEFVRWRALGIWNGAYYEFDGRQIRVRLEDDAIYVLAIDVFDALDLPGAARDPQRIRALAGRDSLVPDPRGKRLLFTERGLDAWLERRTDRKAVDFQRWFNQAVRLPWRGKRANLTGQS